MRYSLNAKRYSWQDVCAILMDLHARQDSEGVSAALWVDKSLEREASRLCAHLGFDELVTIEVGRVDADAMPAAQFLASAAQ